MPVRLAPATTAPAMMSQRANHRRMVSDSIDTDHQQQLHAQQCRGRGEEQQLHQQQRPIAHPRVHPVEREPHQEPRQDRRPSALAEQRQVPEERCHQQGQRREHQQENEDRAAQLAGGSVFRCVLGGAAQADHHGVTLPAG